MKNWAGNVTSGLKHQELHLFSVTLAARQPLLCLRAPRVAEVFPGSAATLRLLPGRPRPSSSVAQPKQPLMEDVKHKKN